jgi:hypothetical protein
VLAKVIATFVFYPPITQITQIVKRNDEYSPVTQTKSA